MRVRRRSDSSERFFHARKRQTNTHWTIRAHRRHSQRHPWGWGHQDQDLGRLSRPARRLMRAFCRDACVDRGVCRLRWIDHQPVARRNRPVAGTLFRQPLSYPERFESGAHPLARVRQTILGQDNGACAPQPVRISAEYPGHSSSIAIDRSLIMTISVSNFEGFSIDDQDAQFDDHAHDAKSPQISQPGYGTKSLFSWRSDSTLV